MLLEEFLKPLGITQTAFALRLGVSFPRLNEVINGKRSSEEAKAIAKLTPLKASGAAR